MKFTNRGSFVEDFSSAQAVGAIGAAYPPATGNQGPPYSLNASIYSTSTQGLFSAQTSFFTAPFSIVDFTVGSDGMYDYIVDSNGPSFSNVIVTTNSSKMTQQQVQRFSQFLSANYFLLNIQSVPQFDNCYYLQQPAMPPAVTITAQALYSGPGNILQWYVVLSSSGMDNCSALTNARQTLNSAAQPTTEWVLGKITSGSNAAVTAVYNISIPTASSGVLNFNPVANQTAFPARQYRAVNINATASATTLILVNYGNWNEVLVISTNSTLPDLYYRAIWSTFNTNLGATKFTGTVSTVKQGSAASCQYPPGVSPPYRSDFDITKCVCAAHERAPRAPRAPRVPCVCVVVCICARVCVEDVVPA